MQSIAGIKIQKTHLLPSRITPLALLGALSFVLVGSGCNNAPEAPTAAQRQSSAQAQIEAIQNNPNMPPAAKQQAIAGIKFQQSQTATQK